MRGNARNMKKAMDDMELPSEGCIPHKLQLVYKGLLSSDTTANARKIIVHFKHSPQAYAHLRNSD